MSSSPKPPPPTRNDRDEQAIRSLRRRHRRLRGVYLIHDGGPSHIAGANGLTKVPMTLPTIIA